MTAVEWVLQYLNNVKPNEFCSIEKIKELLEQAKQMEKQQMCKFAYKCHNHYKVNGDFKIEQYYEQTYGNNNGE